MKSFDLYGSRQLSMDELGAAIQSALTVEFELHESSYMGGDYLLAGDLDGEHLVIQPNLYDDGEEGEMIEPSFGEYPLLLQVNGTARGDELRERLAAIAGLEFLRRELA